MSRLSFGRSALFVVSLLGLMSIFSASAFGAGAPIVTASGATNKTINTATLNGTVNPNGATTTYKIEYGKSKVYGTNITFKSVGGSSPVTVEQILTGLDPRTTYHYRISATNSYGTTVSEDVVFELLLSWHFNGKTLAEWGGPGWPNSVKVATPGSFTIGKTISGNVDQLSCKEDFNFGGHYSSGFPEAQYNLSFDGCAFYVNGVVIKTCQPPETLSLTFNGDFALSKAASIYLSEECAVAEEIVLPAGFGFGIGAAAEQKQMPISVSTPIAGGWTVTYKSTWEGAGALEGMNLGVS